VFSNAVLIEEGFYRCKQGQELQNFAIAPNVQGQIYFRFGVYVQTKAIVYNKGARARSGYTLPCKGCQYHSSRLQHIITQCRYPNDLPVIQVINQVPQ